MGLDYFTDLDMRQCWLHIVYQRKQLGTSLTPEFYWDAKIGLLCFLTSSEVQAEAPALLWDLQPAVSATHTQMTAILLSFR